MPSPVRLADFLTEAYERGGVQSVLALDALFFLMQVRTIDAFASIKACIPRGNTETLEGTTSRVRASYVTSFYFVAPRGRFKFLKLLCCVRHRNRALPHVENLCSARKQLLLRREYVEGDGGDPTDWR